MSVTATWRVRKAKDVDVAAPQAGTPSECLTWDSATGKVVRKSLAVFALVASLAGYAALGGAAFSGPVQVPAGTAGAPGLGVGAATSGLFQPAPDVVGVAVNGSEVARFAASGLTLPGNLTLTTRYVTTNQIERRTGTANLTLDGLGDPVVVQSNSTEIARFNSTGLGIGTNSPGYKLDVRDTLRVMRTSDSLECFRVGPGVFQANLGSGTAQFTQARLYLSGPSGGTPILYAYTVDGAFAPIWVDKAVKIQYSHGGSEAIAGTEGARDSGTGAGSFIISAKAAGGSLTEAARFASSAATFSVPVTIGGSSPNGKNLTLNHANSTTDGLKLTNVEMGGTAYLQAYSGNKLYLPNTVAVMVDRVEGTAGNANVAFSSGQATLTAGAGSLVLNGSTATFSVPVSVTGNVQATGLTAQLAVNNANGYVGGFTTDSRGLVLTHNMANGGLAPNVNGARDLGVATYRWNTIYGVNGDFSSRVYVNGKSALVDDGSLGLTLGEGYGSTGVRVQAPFIVAGTLRHTGTALASTLGSVTRRMPIYDGSGTLLGYIPIYDSIS